MEDVRDMAGCFVAAGKGFVRLRFEQREIDIWLSPGQANGLGEALQCAAVSVGEGAIGGRIDHERFIRKLEKIYAERNQENDEEAP